MSLARLALRIATLEALRPTAAVPTGPFPTLAKGNVFDSRIDPLPDLDPETRVPAIAVYTDEDNGDSGEKAGGPPFKRAVDLVIEHSVVASAEGEDGIYRVGIPFSDADLDASLDLMEAQILFTLMYGPTGKLWRQISGRRVTDIRSLPHRSSEEGERIAMRTLRLKVTIQEDCFDPAPASEPTGNTRLPEPMRSIVAQLAQSSYGAALAQGIADAAPVMPTATPLKTVALNEDVADPQGQRDGTVDVAATADNLDQ